MIFKIKLLLCYNNIFEINVGMKKDNLLSISPLDGRYSDICKDIGNVFSEYSLIKYRVHIEIKWFIYLSKLNKISCLPKLKLKDEKFLNDILVNFNLTDAEMIKKFEKKREFVGSMGGFKLFKIRPSRYDISQRGYGKRTNDHNFWK